MKPITEAMVPFVIHPPTGGETRTYYTEASALGLAAGHWPNRFDTELGNGQPFVLMSWNEHAHLYQQAHGLIRLRVFND